MSPQVRRIGATYRLQIRDVGFAGAVALVPYLSSLGIETLYSSPIFTARAGSTHGYDVIDPGTVDPALGGPLGLEALLATLDAVGMNLLLDVVPNHLAADPENHAFEAALREGQSGSHGAMFDIDWGDAGGRIVLTVLGSPLADALRGRTVTIDPSGTAVTTDAGSYPLKRPVPRQRARRGAAEVAEILDGQHYRLAYWRLRTSELNYRRFFEVDELIALRQEDPAVYRATHGLVLALGADPRVSGLRVDHVDGLADPAGYLERLTADLAAIGGDRPSVLVEKILGATETMPRWPIEGTTGYEFAQQVLGLFIDPDGVATLAEEYRVRTGDDRTFADRQWDAKHKVLIELFPAQLGRAVKSFVEALNAARPGSDVSRTDLEGALSDLICALPVYRTYGAGSDPMTKADASVVTAALDHVRSTSDPEVTRAATLLAGLITGGIQPPSEAFADARRRFQQLAVAVMAKGSEDTALFDPGVPLAGVEVGGRPDAPAVGTDAFHHAMALRLREGGLNTTSTHDTKRSEEVRARLAVLTEIPSLWLLTLDRWRRVHAAFRGSCDVAEEIYLYETIVGLASAGTAASPGFRRRIVDHTRKAAREAKRRTSWTDPDAAHERDLEKLVTAVLSRGNVAFHRDLERMLGRIVEPARVNALGTTVLKVAAPGIPDIYQGTEAGAASLTDPDNRRPVPFDAYARMLVRSGAGKFDPRTTPAPSAAVPDPRKLSVTAGALRVRRDDPELFDRGTYEPIEPSGEHSDHLVAFARTRGRRAVICVVTRWSGSIALSGGRVAGSTWGETGLLLPPDLRGRYADALTGEIHELEATVPIAPVLASLPVALLVRRRR